MLDGQMFKMFAAAIGMTPQDMQQSVQGVVQFIATSEARLTAIEKMVTEIHAATCGDKIDASAAVIDHATGGILGHDAQPIS